MYLNHTPEVLVVERDRLQMKLLDKSMEEKRKEVLSRKWIVVNRLLDIHKILIELEDSVEHCETFMLWICERAKESGELTAFQYDALIVARKFYPVCWSTFERVDAEDNDIPEEKDELDALVDRFLSWPVPESVCSDLCVTTHGEKHRVGTNLLTAIEARQMLKYVLEGVSLKPVNKR